MTEFRQLAADDGALPEVLALIQRCYAYMEGRIDPPSSMHRLSVASIAAQCDAGEVWGRGAPVEACVFLSPKVDHLYVGKLAVDAELRGQGVGGALIALAGRRALALGFDALELDVRIELLGNHGFFEACGFAKVAAWAHKGYARPTCLRMRKSLRPSQDGAGPV